jgi:hypothetical protein
MKESKKNLKLKLKEDKKFAIEVKTEEIKGIVYYVDHKDRIYHPEDVLEEKIDSRIIGNIIIKEGKRVLFLY